MLSGVGGWIGPLGANANSLLLFFVSLVAVGLEELPKLPKGEMGVFVGDLGLSGSGDFSDRTSSTSLLTVAEGFLGVGVGAGAGAGALPKLKGLDEFDTGALGTKPPFDA